MASNYSVMPASATDTEEVVACRSRAHATGPVFQAVFPEEKAHLTTPEELRQWRLRRQSKYLNDPDAVWHKAVLNDQPAHIVGYAGWTKPGSRMRKAESTAKVRQQAGEASSHGIAEEAPAHLSSSDADFPACMDVELQHVFDAQIEANRKEIWGEDDDFWYLIALSVDPAHQRKGIASALLTHGLRQVDAEGLPAYLEATPDGAHVYPKFGFEHRRYLDVLDSSHPSHHQVDIMVRPITKLSEG